MPFEYRSSNLIRSACHSSHCRTFGGCARRRCGISRRCRGACNRGIHTRGASATYSQSSSYSIHLLPRLQRLPRWTHYGAAAQCTRCKHGFAFICAVCGCSYHLDSSALASPRGAYFNGCHPSCEPPDCGDRRCRRRTSFHPKVSRYQRRTHTAMDRLQSLAVVRP